MAAARFQRRLLIAALVGILTAALLSGAILLILSGLGAYGDSAGPVVLTVAISFVATLASLGAVAYRLGRSLDRAIGEMRIETELMASVNPDHRLAADSGGALESLAAEINRLADHLRQARTGLEAQVAQATEELAIERGKLSAVLEALGEGVILATPEGRVSLANPAAENLLGADLLGRSLFDFVDREKVGHFLDLLRAGASLAERFSLHPAGGGVLQAAMTPFLDGERRLVGFILVLRDVTHVARSDQEHRRLLADAVRDLRNPIAAIRSLSESLLSAPDLVTGAGGPLLRALHAEAVRLSAAVRAIGEPAGLGLAAVPWHFEQISVAALASTTLRRLGPDAERIDATGIKAAAVSLAPLRVEVSALGSALADLLRAVLARGEPAAGAWLRFDLRGRLVQVEAGAAGSAAPADLEALLDRPDVTRGAGSLAIREILRQHAGEVWAYAEGGSFGFRLTLPIQSGESGQRREVAGGTAPSSFVGAGTVSAWEGGGATERSEFYDFSLLEEMEGSLPPAYRDRPLSEVTYVVFDTETTGLDPEAGDRIVSIAGVKVRAGVVKRGETFDALVNPGRPIPDASVAFHGITDDMVADAPSIAVVFPAFLRFAGDAVMVGEQVWFDLRCLAAEARRLGLPPTPAHPALDTVLLSALVHRPLAGHGLDATARRLGVAVRGRHSALGDALATAEVFVRLLELLQKRGVTTLGELLDAARAYASRGP